MILPFLLACTDYGLAVKRDAPGAPPEEALADTGSSGIPITSSSNFPLSQMLGVCSFQPTICPANHADCSAGINASNTKMSDRLIAAASQLPADQYTTDDVPTLDDILANKVSMTVLDFVSHDVAISDSDWDGSDWSDVAWTPREYNLWIALGDHAEELAQAAPELLDYSKFDRWDSPVTLPFDTIHCTAYSYVGGSLISPFIGTTIESFLFPKDDTHPFPVVYDATQDILDDYEPQPEADRQLMFWYNTDNVAPGGSGSYFKSEGDDLSTPISETNSYAGDIRDSALNALGLTAYSDPTEQTQVLYHNVND